MEFSDIGFLIRQLVSRRRLVSEAVDWLATSQMLQKELKFRDERFSPSVGFSLF